MAITVGVRELRDGLTRHLRRVRRGGRVVVSDRGRPIAVLVPYRAGDAAGRADRLTALLQSGQVQPAERPFLRRPPLVRGHGRPVSELIVEGRR
jgi:prevent-host-death family protein